ncbi:MAG: hypothetical protein RL536_346 [Candidatus Parcubacteria bacterium]|jgi:glycosyltransferase involved in cell wall biosynthesis
MAKIFIGMPAYNGERFIKKAVDSIRNQTFGDWKLYISDDHSSDATADICKNYSKLDNRIVYHRQEKNIGLYKNFGFVLDKADCEYFIWCAQDDMREDRYLETCVRHLEENKKLGLATTIMAAIDSMDRMLIEEVDLIKLSGKPGVVNVARYVLQPEILGKCNLMYGLFRTKAAKIVWEAYPQRHVWGQDYMFSLALISRFEIFVDKKILFKKRLGGFSSPQALRNDRTEGVKRLLYKNPKNHIFPFGRFRQYLGGHLEAVRGTPFGPLVAILLLIRLPRSFLIYLRERDVKKYIRSIMHKPDVHHR